MDKPAEDKEKVGAVPAAGGVRPLICYRNRFDLPYSLKIVSRAYCNLPFQGDDNYEVLNVNNPPPPPPK